MIATWDDLHRELDRWQEAGRAATLWWRDDDAACASPALGRLLDLAEGRPLALAVIPARAEPSLARALDGRPDILVLQHGFDHVNRAIPGDKKCELGAGRPAHEIAADLGRGRDLLQDRFGARFIPALVPPWNRIAPGLVGDLPGLGFIALSTYNARRSPNPAPGLAQVNTHVDLQDWQAGCFVGEPRALGLLTGHLAARREGRADAGEPTGLLTHHLVQDAATDAFLGALCRTLDAHSAVSWPALDSVLAGR